MIHVCWKCVLRKSILHMFKDIFLQFVQFSKWQPRISEVTCKYSVLISIISFPSKIILYQIVTNHVGNRLHKTYEEIFSNFCLIHPRQQNDCQIYTDLYWFILIFRREVMQVMQVTQVTEELEEVMCRREVAMWWRRGEGGRDLGHIGVGIILSAFTCH